MSWDLRLSPLGDLEFAPNRDLSWVDGVALTNQRIAVRLKIHRGSWIFDDDHSLGSRLDSLLGKGLQRVAPDVESFVQEALMPMMDEITITRTQVTTNPDNPREISVLVTYHPIVLASESALPIEGSQIQVLVPIQG